MLESIQKVLKVFIYLNDNPCFQDMSSSTNVLNSTPPLAPVTYTIQERFLQSVAFKCSRLKKTLLLAASRTRHKDLLDSNKGLDAHLAVCTQPFSFYMAIESSVYKALGT